MGLQSYRELEVWQRSIDMVEMIYELTRSFPAEEKFGLTSQMRRAAVSVPSNIAEGYGRSARGDYLQHLSIARGSLAELETQLYIALRLGYTSREQSARVYVVLEEVGKRLTRLKNALQTKPHTQNPRPAPQEQT